MLAELMGSNPSLLTFINLVNYSTESRLLLDVFGFGQSPGDSFSKILT
jgi:hypothetical protein